MRGVCDSGVAIISGYRHAVGRKCSSMWVRQQAIVFVNVSGAGTAGRVADVAPEHLVFDEVRAFGGVAAMSGGEVSNCLSAVQVIAQTIATFG